MIEILNYEPANKNKIIGYVDVKVSLKDISMIIRKIAHFQTGEKRWFNLATFSKEKENGFKEFLRYWQFESEVHNNQFLDALGDKVKEFCEKNNIKPIEPLNFEEMVPTSSDELPF